MAISDDTDTEGRERQRLATSVSAALSRLTANLLRVVGAAGRPEDLQEQAARFITACDQYEALVGQRAWLQISPCVGLTDGKPHKPWDPRLNPREQAQHGPREDMLVHALRLVAARIMGQRSHEVMAESALIAAAERYAGVPAALAKAEKDRLRIVKADLARKTASRRRKGTAIRREP